MLKDLAPAAEVTASGSEFPFPPDLDDGPLRAHVGDYPSIAVRDGIETTFRAFTQLVAEGRMDATAIG